MTNMQSQTGVTEVGGGQLSYEIAGDGPALVLLHAGIADRRMWDDQFPVFAQHFRTVRYDLPGFGQSRPNPGAFSHSADLYDLLQHLGIERAHLIGVSMSGATILDFALEHPEMVTALIPVCGGVSGFAYEGPNPPGWDEIEAEEAAIDALIAAGDKDQAMRRMAELDVRVWVDGMYRTPEQVDARVRELVKQMTVAPFAYLDIERTRRTLEPPAVERLHEIAAPTLVIVGEVDLPEVHAAAEIMVQRIPGARKVVMHGTAHLPNMEQPEQFNEIVLDFLQAR